MVENASIMRLEECMVSLRLANNVWSKLRSGVHNNAVRSTSGVSEASSSASAPDDVDSGRPAGPRPPVGLD